MKIKLGKVYRDTISGFEGTATSRVEFLYGCVRVHLEPSGLHDGKPIEGQYFDEQRLVEAKTGTKPKATATAGGPYPDPPRHGY